jgi:uncharacterized protein
MSEDTLLTFPCSFPLKVMGKKTPELLAVVADVIAQQVPGFDPKSLVSRDSKAGNYVALTATFTATSKPQIDALYRVLSAHPLIAMVL